jgi:prepilin-type N-terminal cleavage/methylation domain-containing protein
MSPDRQITDSPSEAGITLLEMLIVVAIVGLLVGITFPSVSAGIDSLRLSSASDSLVSFFNSALNRAQRRQQVMEVTISTEQNTVRLRSTEPGYERTLEMPEGVRILNVLPSLPQETIAPRRFMLYPGGAVPRFGVEIGNRKGRRRIVRVDPVTGVPQVERVEAL